MDSNYKNIKKLLSEEQTNLPPELNWDTMESGILNKMDQIESENLQKRKQNWKRRLSFFGLTLLLILTPMICTQFTEKYNGEWASNDLKSEETIENLEEVVNPSKNTNSKAGDDKSKNKSFDNIKNDKQGSYAIGSNEPQATKTKNTQPESSTLISETSIDKRETAGLESTIDSKANQNSNSKVVSTLNSSIPSQTIDLNSGTKSEGTLKTLIEKNTTLVVAGIGSKNFQLIRNYKPNFKLGQPMLWKSDKKPIKSQNRLGLSSGILFWNMGFGSNNPERQTFESTRLSFGTNINFTHTFKNNLVLMTGLQYQQLESKFDGTKIIDDHKVLLTDVVIEVQGNSLTGGKKTIIGDVEVEVEALRTVRNYNQSTLIQLPLAIGKTYYFGNWQADALFGSALTIFSTNEGKTLYQKEIIEYSGSSTPFMNSDWKVNALAMARIAYNFNSTLSLGANFQYQRSITNWSTEDNIAIRPQFYSLQLGIMASF